MKPKIQVSEFFEKLKPKLRFRLCAGKEGLSNFITVAELNRPGLALAGHIDYFASKRVQVLGKAEISYLASLDANERYRRLELLFKEKVPCVILARKIIPSTEFIELANKYKTPLIRSHYMTMKLINQGTIFLEDQFAPSMTINGDEVEIFGVGVLILGKSGVGKSETTLGLVSKGHRLVCDDVVRLKLTESDYIIGEGAKITRHFMELRGIGIINVQTLFGVGSVKERKRVELVISLEKWDPEKEYERLGLESEYMDFMGVKLPHITIPVRPGRDVISLVEVAALNHRLKKLGINPALELNNKLVAIMKKKALGENESVF
ncbi:MAG: HPr(Ser) kinase/phosphatase [Candidatus Auribacterota bacterium]|jgi:HPr kinase/phosphorylase|nr:HPr(Ser) kinase/phosphatase [Candidatus Auribacterota bacterium]